MIPNRRSSDHYDVFLSYTSADLPSVTEIASALKDKGLSVWFDKWILRPGDMWMEELEKGIVKSRVIAVVVGPRGIGEWANSEMRAAIDRSVKRKARVVPVLLPGVLATDERIPLMLQNLQFCVMEGAVDDTAIDRLIWGITGQNPLQARTQEYQSSIAPQDTEEQDATQAAVESLAKHLTAGNVTFFFGRSAVYPTSNSEIASKLLSEMGLIDSEWTKLLPPLDLAASFFAVKHGDAKLEDHVIDIMSMQNADPPASYIRLATLQRSLATRQAIRGRKQFKQLIVSSNLDLLLEKALLLQGVPFTRLVQFRSSPRVQINTIAGVQKLADGRVQISGPNGGGGVVDPNDDAALGALISSTGKRNVVVQGGSMCDEKSSGGGMPVSTADMIEPILYKLHGSQDVAKSCAISTEQYFDTLWRSIDQKCIPDEFATILSNTPVVLVGSRILDADFRLSYTLLRASLESGTDQPRFAVMARSIGDDRDGSHKLAKRAWDELSVMALKKYSIQMLDEHEDVFFTKLTEAFLAPR